MKKLLYSSTLFFALFLATQVFPHAYHYEIQLTNELQTNNQNQLEALKLTFLYDGDVSKVMLQDQNNLDKLAKKLITDLGEIGYFTQVKLNGKVLELTKASDIELDKIHVDAVNADDKNQEAFDVIQPQQEAFDVLQLQFRLALKIPIKITKNSVISFVHKDPTATATLYYPSTKNILINGELKESCKSITKEKDNFPEGEFSQIVQINCNP